MMLCGEIEDIAKKGSLSHETLDILKDLVETEKNLAKIEKYGEEKEEKEEMQRMGSMGMDNGYSQRKYYIDADYNPMGHSFNRGYDYGMDGNSYARGRQGGMYDMDGNSYNRGMGGNSYLYYDPRYDMPMMGRRGYSGTASKKEMIEELKEMMKDATDEKVRMAISEAITKMDM